MGLQHMWGGDPRPSARKLQSGVRLLKFAGCNGPPKAMFSVERGLLSESPPKASGDPLRSWGYVHRQVFVYIKGKQVRTHIGIEDR